jgi:recombinational DNA repair ATPase RecF
VAKWVLEAIEITGGFLPGLSLRLPPGLTCIIGARGSGKSTLIEALRYGTGGLSGALKARAGLIQANPQATRRNQKASPDAGEAFHLCTHGIRLCLDITRGLGMALWE